MVPGGKEQYLIRGGLDKLLDIAHDARRSDIFEKEEFTIKPIYFHFDYRQGINYTNVIKNKVFVCISVMNYHHISEGV